MILNKISPDKNFTIIDNSILRNKDLSIQARMLYMLLQSFPSEWEVNLKHLSEILNVSEASVRKYRNELVNAGLITYRQILDEKGKFTQEMIYTFLHTQAQEVDYIPQNAPSYPFAQKSAYGESSTPINIEYINKKDSKESMKNPKTTPLFFTLLSSYKYFKDTNLRKNKPFLADLPNDANTFSLAERESFKAFLAYRRERGFVAKSTIDSIIRDFVKLKQSGADIKACVELCINRGWSGILKANEALRRYESYKKPSFAIASKTPRPIDNIKI